MPEKPKHITPWLCPVCKHNMLDNPLELANNSWRCALGHSFDRAKEGYANLLLAQHKNSKDPGDNKDMVLARRAFLEQDHYLPLATEITSLIKTTIQKLGVQSDGSAHVSIYDAGCGEGYYLAKIKQQLLADNIEIVASGSDISKTAMQKAAKKHPDIYYAVASSFNLPVATASQDIVIQVFAPSSTDEIKRILTGQGCWVHISPAPEHLFALKQQVYDSPDKHEAETKIPEGFELVTQRRLSFNIVLDDLQQRQNLLMMTPFYWTISAEKKQLLLENLSSVSADFDIKLMRKKPDLALS